MRKTFFIILGALCLFSCKHEIERPQWDVEILVPLVHTKMNINNILSDSNLNVSESSEGFINLIYRSRDELDLMVQDDVESFFKNHKPCNDHPVSSS